MQKTQLFLLHFAGGNCYSFQFLFPLLKEFEVIALELPGRGKRMMENLLTNFDDAAEDIYQQIASKRNAAGCMIYGHSMGAYLGLKVSHMLEQNNLPVDYLIVSGNAGPGVPSSKIRYLMEQEPFIEELKILGGIPSSFFEEPELMSFFMPILRADFEIAERNGLTQDLIVNTPIFAMMGTEEEKVGKISNWGKFTSKKFNHCLLPGGHFFINDHGPQLADVLKDCHKQTTEKIISKVS
jgi:surfactin synthase thioesterase subunit